MNDRIQVLMSTYNGSRYLREQIDSVLHQKDVEVSLLIRDDGSTDDTLTILEEYKAKYSNVDYYSGSNAGPAMSFIDLIMKSGDYPYFAFADQDDVWEEDKLARALDKFREIDPLTPTTYYSNLKIVDQNLVFYRLSHKRSHTIKNKYGALIDNKATGCTMVFNKSACDLTKQASPKKIIMHDAWLFLVCSMFGKTVYDPEARILYRQHGDNVIGTYLKRKSLKTYVYKIRRLFDKKNQPRYWNAVEFNSCYGDRLTEEERRRVGKIIHYKKSFAARLSLFFDRKIRATPFMLDLRYRLLILFGVI